MNRRSLFRSVVVAPLAATLATDLDLCVDVNAASNSTLPIKLGKTAPNDYVVYTYQPRRIWYLDGRGKLKIIPETAPAEAL